MDRYDPFVRLGVSVVVPCFNEAGSVAAVVAEARDALATGRLTGEIIVVDNGSLDGSGDLARAAGATVIVEQSQGYGTALIAGFRAAQGEVVVMADADGSYDLAAIPDFVAKVHSGDDLVMGSRFRGHIEPGAMPWHHRHIGNPILSGILNFFFHTGASDAHCGIRAFRRDRLDDLHLRMAGMELASEMVVNAARSGLRIGEIPVTYRVRIGKSKLRSLRDGWRHLRFLLLYSPTHLFLLPGTALLGIGLFLLVALLPGPLDVFGRSFDIHLMVLGALLALLGSQIVIVGLFAKALAIALGLQPRDRTLEVLRSVFSLERGLLAGMLLFGVGLVIDIVIASTWIRSGLGALDEVRTALFALVAMLLGVQVAFSSFFLSAIELQARG